MVTQFHMTGWPEHGRPASTGSVLELLDMTTSSQMNSGNRPITVICKSDSVVCVSVCLSVVYLLCFLSHFTSQTVLSLTLSISQLSYCLPFSNLTLPLSSDGVGRTGTFICLHSQLERLKTEGVVDVLQAVKSARIQRAGLVRNAVCLH